MANSTVKTVVEEGHTLDRIEAYDLLEAMFRGNISDDDIEALLLALNNRGETVEEIVGFVEAMRTAMEPVPLNEAERAQLVDACGTGGDRSGTFNISTGAALVAAAAGAIVAKHGNRAVTSRTGSADVLEALGIPVNQTPQAAADALRRHGFAFLLAGNHHPKIKAVMPARIALGVRGVRSIFNIIGPLTNPAGAKAQVMGVYAANLVHLVANAMATLGVRHALVVHGDGNLDELALSGPSQYAEVRGRDVRLATLQPEDVGLSRAPLTALAGGNDAQANAEILRRIFSGQESPCRDVVLLNAAAVLYTAGVAPGLREGIALAAAAIDEGKVTALVTALSKK